MGYPIYDVSVRTSQVTSAQVLCALLPAAAAAGTGRPLRMRQISVSNTTATGFGIGLGQATSAGVTPGAGSAPTRRGPSTVDPASTAQSCYTTYATQPTAPSTYNARLWVPGNSLVIWVFPEGEEYVVMPASTPFPFCLWNTGTGQISDVTLSWEE